MPRYRKPFPEYMQDQWAALGSVLKTGRRKARRLANRYAAVFEVPFGTSFALRRIRPGARETNWYTPSGAGGLKRLQMCHLIWHLRQEAAVAVARAKSTRLLTIDLDAKTIAAKATLATRYREVQRALADAPHVLIRSSNSGGLHLLFFFTVAYDPAEIHQRVTAALTRAGLPVRPGSVEVMPSVGRKIRLPLGPGSVLLKPKTMNPAKVAGRADAIRLLLRLAERLRVSLTRLVGQFTRHPLPGSVLVPGPAIAPPRASGAPGPHSAAYAARLRACIDGVSDYGRRFEESRFLIRHWTVVKRLPRAEVLKKHKRWVLHGKHRSKDLERDHDQTVRRMLLDAPKMVDSCLAWMRSHPRGGTAPLKRGRGSSMASFVAEARARASKLGLSWRQVVLGYLKRTDRRALVQIRDQWLREKVALFKATLNFGLAEVNRCPQVSMWSRTLQAIIGGRPPPGPEPVLWGKERPRGAAYVLVLRKAERLGWIRLLSDAAEGRSRVYEVILDRRRRKRDPEDSP